MVMIPDKISKQKDTSTKMSKSQTNVKNTSDYDFFIIPEIITEKKIQGIWNSLH